MVRKIEKIHVNGDAVNLKYSGSILGWKVVHPIRNEEGKIIWINFLIGGWANLFALLVIIIMAFSLLHGIDNMMEDCQKLAENPCYYVDCNAWMVQNSSIAGLELNISKVVTWETPS